ncbi:hypothetical protein MP228_010645 [Amoeboaphelidium protococcarum]|nr:hypothetical protein MP228_010645 [Amoeboaphelidium protococcarum]
MNDFVHKNAHLIYALTGIGFLFAVKLLLSLLVAVYDVFVASGVNVKAKYGGADHYALITGSTDGIGKEYALQLAKRGLNIILVSRTHSKLDAVAEEIKRASPSAEVVTEAIDFSKITEKNWKSLDQLSAKYKITVLVNNVAMNHGIPTPFAEEEQSVIDNILRVNCDATLRITKSVLNGMIQRSQAKQVKNALILNIGSFAGLIPTAYLQTYSATKSFLKTFSVALAQEVKQYGIHVEHHNTYFVVSNMSKISRPSMMIPTAKSYVSSALSRVGTSYDVTPYFAHNVMAKLFNMVPQWILVNQTYSMQVSIRKRALRKAERLNKKE